MISIAYHGKYWKSYNTQYRMADSVSNMQNLCGCWKV